MAIASSPAPTTSWANLIPDPTVTNDLKASPEQDIPVANTKGFLGASKQPSPMTAVIGVVEDVIDIVFNRNGAPSIDEPLGDFSVEDLVDLLRDLHGKSEAGQLKAAQENVSTTSIKSKQNNDAQLKATTDWVKKCDEAKDQGHFGKLFNWVAKIGAVVLAAVFLVAVLAGTIGTAGAMGPLLVVGVLALVAASSALADQISKETGGDGFSPAALLAQGTSKILQKFGMDEEQADRIGKIVVGAAAILIPGGLALVMIDPTVFGNMMEGILQMADVDPQTTAYVVMAVTVVTTIAVAIATAALTGGAGGVTAMARALKVTEALMQGSNAIVQGGTGIAVGITQSEADDLQADKKELQSAAMKLQQVMQDGLQDLKKVIQQIEDGVKVVTQIMTNDYESRQQITQNQGGGGMA